MEELVERRDWEGTPRESRGLPLPATPQSPWSPVRPRIQSPPPPPGVDTALPPERKEEEEKEKK